MRNRILMIFALLSMVSSIYSYTWPISGYPDANPEHPVTTQSYAEKYLTSFYGLRTMHTPTLPRDNNNHQGIDIGVRNVNVKTVTTSRFVLAKDEYDIGRGKYLIYEDAVNNNITYPIFREKSLILALY